MLRSESLKLETLNAKPGTQNLKPETIHQLLTLNRSFYDSVAEPFAQSRARPQPGFSLLLDYLPQPCPHLLDVGCGEGRLGRFLQEREVIEQYTGIDFSAELLAKASVTTTGRFLQRDISQPGCLDGLGQFDVIACLAVLQHIPGRANRVNLLRTMGEHVGERGRVILSTWQFLSSTRQQRKITDWSKVGLTPDEVEPHDYLLSWQKGKTAWRYVCLIDEAELTTLAHSAGLHLSHTFRSDGHEGDLSLYAVLVPENN